MAISIRQGFLWLLLGPCLALLITIPSWYVFNSLSPDKLTGIQDMIGVYPKGLLMSLLTPWGWLMYGGFLLMSGERRQLGVVCTVTGALVLGLFMPVWSTFLVST